MYIGIPNSIYKSINGGLSWFEINQDIGVKNVSHIIIDHQNPDILYCIADQDVYKSTNGDMNWNHISNEIQSNVIEMHPIYNNILYLGTYSSDALLYLSIDYGTTWQLIGNNLEGDFVTGIVAISVNEVYIGTRLPLFPQGQIVAKVYKSINYGYDFEMLGDGFYYEDYVSNLSYDLNNSEIYTYNKKVWKFNEQNNCWEEYYKGSFIRLFWMNNISVLY